MLGRLRIEAPTKIPAEDTQMITPRIPKSLHQFLINELIALQAQGHKVSLNQLVIMKLGVPYNACVLPPNH